MPVGRTGLLVLLAAGAVAAASGALPAEADARQPPRKCNLITWLLGCREQQGTPPPPPVYNPENPYEWPASERNGSDADPPTIAARPDGRPQLGFTEHWLQNVQWTPQEDAALAQHARMLRDSGATLMRIAVDWRFAEPEEGDFDIAWIEKVARVHHEHGIGIVPMLIGSPNWAFSDERLPCNQDFCPYPPSSRNMDEWGDFAGRVADRLSRWAVAFEIWNEANLKWYFKPRPDPERFARMVQEASPEIRREAPGVPIMVGGLNGLIITGDDNLSVGDFVKQFYGARRNPRGHFEAISFHPYPGHDTHDSQFYLSFRQLRTALAEVHDPGRRIWVTEFGLSTTHDDPKFRVTEQQQADEIVRHYGMLSDMVDVDAVVIHSFVEPTTMIDPGGPGYGVVRPDLSPKLAYCAIAGMLGAPGVPACG